MPRNQSVALLLAASMFLLGGAIFGQSKTGQSPKPPARKALPKQLPPDDTGEPAPAEAQPYKTKKVTQPEAGQKTRPAAQPLRIQKTAAQVVEEPLSPELEQILIDWETKSAQIQTLSCTFKKWRYVHNFAVDYRSEGLALYKAPDHGVYKLAPSKITPDLKGRAIGKDNKPVATPYDLKPDDAEEWYCDGKSVTKINVAAKTYEKIDIPADMQGERIIEGPLPFLFGMKAEAAKARYTLKLLKRDEAKREIWLSVKPKQERDYTNYQSAVVVLDDEQFTPKAVKLLDPTGNTEIVHTFQSMKVNGKLSTFGDPFSPKSAIAGKKPVVREVPVVADNKNGADPQPKKTAQLPPEARKPSKTAPPKKPLRKPEE